MLCIGSAFTVLKAILAAAFIGTLAAAERFMADLATAFVGAFPAFHGLMANLAAALIGTLAGCRAFHGRFGDGVRRGVSGRFLRFTGRHFGGFIANFAAAMKHFLSVVGRREHSPRPSQKRSLVPSQRPSAIAHIIL